MLDKQVMGPFRFVMQDDPAVDPDGTDYEKYILENCNWEHLKIKDGERPTVFTIKSMTRRQRLRRDNYSGLEQADFTARCCLTKVENLRAVIDGEAVDVDGPERKAHGDLGPMVSEGWMDKVNLESDTVAVLGFVGLALSEAKVPLLLSLLSLSGE